MAYSVPYSKRLRAPRIVSQLFVTVTAQSAPDDLAVNRLDAAGTTANPTRRTQEANQLQ
jgi:hypothetical protein